MCRKCEQDKYNDNFLTLIHIQLNLLMLLLIHQVKEETEMNELPKELFTSKEIREYFKISISTLDNWIAEGVPKMRIGRQNRYDIHAVAKWLEERNKEEK